MNGRMRCLVLAWLAPLLGRASAAAPNGSQVLRLLSTAYGTALTAEVGIGNQTFRLLLDTGSADLWVLDAEWQCYEKSASAVLGPQTSRAACAYGDGTYIPSETYSPMNDSWLGVHYAAGDVLGTMARDNVLIGNITIPQQAFGIVNATNGPSGQVSEGIMGLGYPILSRTHSSDYTPEIPADLALDSIPRQTVLLNLAEALEEPYFAFAEERTPLDQETAFGGYMSFGTLPPVEHSNAWTTVSVEPVNIPGQPADASQSLQYWTTSIDAVTLGDQRLNISHQGVIDIGHPYFVVPQPLSDSLAAQFDPPGAFYPDGSLGPLYAVECDATPPSNVSIEIGGTSFPIDSEDMIYRDFDDSCYSIFAPAVPSEGIVLFILPSHFLRNVVAVFDFGNDEMRFAGRIRNGSETSDHLSLAQEENGGSSVLFGPGGLALMSPLLTVVLLL